MNLHKHARLTPRGRAFLVQGVLNGLRVEDAAQAGGVSVRTAYKWLRRFREEVEAGLIDRSSRPHSCPHATAAVMIELRRSRKTYRQIAQMLGLAVSNVVRRLKQAGLHRLAALEPAPVVVRYEYANLGDLLHLDIKKLVRFWKPGHWVSGDRQQFSEGAGWKFVHMAINDASRLAFTSLHPDERGRSACQALLQALRYYRGLSISFRRVMTHNGACYRSRAFQRLCTRLGLRHIRTRPYTLQTNGKADRFIQTPLREWAYARSYASSEQRAAHLPDWLNHYNWHRPPASLDYKPPISRAGLPLNNVLGLHN